MSGLDPVDGTSMIDDVPDVPTTIGVGFDETGPQLDVGTEAGDTSSEWSTRDPEEIYRFLAEHDPGSLAWFVDRLERWVDAQSWTPTSWEIEHPRAAPDRVPAPAAGPSTPTARAGRITDTAQPQAAESSPAAPRSPQDRAAGPPSTGGPRADPSDVAPPPVAMSYNERRHWEQHDALQREVDRLDPDGDPGKDLQTRVEQLPPDKRARIEDHLAREWVRAEEERLSTVVLGRNGRVWTRGEEEQDLAAEVFEQGLERAGAAAGSLGGALLMSAGNAAGVNDHAALMGLAAVGSAGEEAFAGRVHSSRRSVGGTAPRARRPSTRTVRRKTRTPAPRGGRSPRPRMDPTAAKELGISKREVRTVERIAEIFGEEMAARASMPDQTAASVQAHKATQDRAVREFGDTVIVEPGTGVSAPGHKLGDVQVHRPSGNGVMLELKRTTFIRTDGTVVTKGRERDEPGQPSQIDALEVLHHQLGTPVVVIERNGRMFASTRMYDEHTGGGWKVVGSR